MKALPKFEKSSTNDKNLAKMNKILVQLAFNFGYPNPSVVFKNNKIITQMHEFGFFVFRRIRIFCVISDKNVNCGTNHQFTGYNLDSVNVCSGIEFYSQFLKKIILGKDFFFKIGMII